MCMGNGCLCVYKDEVARGWGYRLSMPEYFFIFSNTLIVSLSQ